MRNGERNYMENNRTTSLVKNVGLFFIASFGTKFLSFFLVPLYTSLVSTEDYGISDFLNTLVSLLMPVLMLDISDAIMFFSFRAETPTDKQQPLLYGDRILRVSSTLLAIVLAVVALATGGRNMLVYCIYILLRYFLDAFHLNMLAYMRSVNEVRTITISSLLSSATMLTMNVVLIVWLDLGLYALLISSLAGLLASNLYCVIKTKYWRFARTPIILTKQQKKQMLAYSIPLIFSGLAWWVNGSLDRFFVTYYCGIGINGIYAMANKIPTLLNAVHTVIYQAMQLSVFTEMRAKDGKEYMKRLYSIYTFIMVLACSALIMLDKPLAKYLFKGDYYVAWQYVPAMLISAAIFSIAGYITIIATATKETKTIAVATVSGAVLNILLNWLLIPRIGLFGAVIATALGYFVIWLVLILKAEMALEIRFPKLKSIFMFLLLVAQWVVLLIGQHMIVLEAILFLALCLLNLATIHDLWGIVVRFLRSIFTKLQNRKRRDPH